jgi:hypothetical protein
MLGMKQRAHDIQYTVRGIPQEVDQALRRKAARRKLSLDQIIVEELTSGTIGRRKRADFHDVAGQWTPDPMQSLPPSDRSTRISGNESRA